MLLPLFTLNDIHYKKKAQKVQTKLTLKKFLQDVAPASQNGTEFVRRHIEHEMQKLRRQVPVDPSGSEQIPKQVTLVDESHAVQSRDGVAEP